MASIACATRLLCNIYRITKQCCAMCLIRFGLLICTVDYALMSIQTANCLKHPARVLTGAVHYVCKRRQFFNFRFYQTQQNDNFPEIYSD